MPGPFPVEPRRPAPSGTRTLVLGVVRATGAAAAERAGGGTSATPIGRWSPYRLPGGFTRRVVGRLDRLLVERAAGLHGAARARRRAAAGRR